VFKKQGGEPLFVALGHDEVLCFAVSGADGAEDFLPSYRPAVGAVAVGGESALIDIDDVAACVLGDEPAQFLKIADALIVVSLGVIGRFFLTPMLSLRKALEIALTSTLKTTARSRSSASGCSLTCLANCSLSSLRFRVLA